MVEINSGLHLNLDAGAGFGGIGPYYPIIEKVCTFLNIKKTSSYK